jgi:hypothetical protein
VHIERAPSLASRGQVGLGLPPSMASAIPAASHSCFSGLTVLIPPNCYERDFSPLRTSAIRNLSPTDSKLPLQITAFWVSASLLYRLAVRGIVIVARSPKRGLAGAAACVHCSWHFAAFAAPRRWRRCAKVALEVACATLVGTDPPSSIRALAAAYHSPFYNPGRFAKLFKAAFGQFPSGIRRPRTRFDQEAGPHPG